MASEILSVPEEHLAEVIYVIRRGLLSTKKSLAQEVLVMLTKWCDEEEEYLKRLKEE